MQAAVCGAVFYLSSTSILLVIQIL